MKTFKEVMDDVLVKMKNGQKNFRVKRILLKWFFSCCYGFCYKFW